MANTYLYVLDANLQPVPIGIPGELFIGGEGVARGYVGRPELTREHFVANPFAKSGSERLYRTGDVVRWSADGQLEFLQRTDSQVKIRGYRIELGEIEAALSTHPLVSRCAVIAHANSSGDTSIAAYVAAPSLQGDIRYWREIWESTYGNAGLEMASTALVFELKNLTAQQLPDYMVPVTINVLDALPLSANGKVDRKALAALGAPPPIEEPRLKAGDALEQSLAEIWKDVLNVSTFDVRRTFFENGGNSLKILHVQQRIRARLAIDVSVANLFKYPTIETLAADLRRRLTEGTRSAKNDAVEVPGRTTDAAILATEIKTSLADIERSGAEPIAIVGMACRMPGSGDMEALWRGLDEGSDLITTFSWNGAAISCGVVETLAEFDTDFFRISPREAQRMDPRQRLLLEVSWEALERAGIPAASLEGEHVGVYIGASGNGYAEHLYRPDTQGEAYDVTGSLAAVIAGRVSYFLGLRGPSMTIDTACSSSLVAVHVAMKALRARECEVALAGGVEALPRNARESEAWLALGHISELGRCRPFDASADGIVGGEGCGVVVLKRLSTAKRDGDRILAVLRGSAINHDGRTQGLTVPSGLAQEDVIRAALSQAGVRPHEVGYVECHGTGTVLGDPIEVQALGSVLGEDRERSRPVVIGSVKSNLGHTGAAAGVAGLIKVVLSLQHERIPRSLHFDAPNPHIAWDELAVRVASEAVPWARNGVARIAGVSSFGVSGTNAHVVVEEAPVEAAIALASAADAAEAAPSLLPLPAWPLLLSARSEAALKGQAERLRAHVLAHPELSLADLAYSLATTRTAFEHRAAIVTDSHDALVSALDALAYGRPAPATTLGRARGEGKVVFVFPGQGSQWQGMALSLLDTSPVFRARLEACEAALAPHVDWSLLSVLHSEDESLLDRIDVVQPALFAVMVALAAEWRAIGVTPDAVVGHSQGEVAAAVVAGALSLEDGAKIVALRSQALNRLAGKGGMIAVELGVEALGEHFSKWGERLSIAAINSAQSTLVSGDAEVLDAFAADLMAAEIFARKVRVDYASHCAQVGGCPRRAPGQSGRPLTARRRTSALFDGDRGHRRWQRTRCRLLGTAICARLSASARRRKASWPTGSASSSRSARIRS